MTRVLVTGAAGFIGYHLCELLIAKGYNVIGLDNVNDYYDVKLKYARLEKLGIARKEAMIYNFVAQSEFHGSKMQFTRAHLEDRDYLSQLFTDFKFELVCNLAAQAGVRYSIENPYAYIDSNINGFINILECCREHRINRLVYASSSSVYGNSNVVPFKESLNVDNPISLYAATKKSNELMAHTYSHLFGIETIGLRFFTVYGPWGRPDMALFLFVKAIVTGQPINVYNNGKLSRDFTYVDDIVQGILITLTKNSKNRDLYKIYNIGNNAPVKLMSFIDAIERELNIICDKNFLPAQPGDVSMTWADVDLLQKDYGYKVNTNITHGVKQFINWYKEFYKLNE